MKIKGSEKEYDYVEGLDKFLARYELGEPEYAIKTKLSSTLFLVRENDPGKFEVSYERNCKCLLTPNEKELSDFFANNTRSKESIIIAKKDKPSIVLTHYPVGEFGIKVVSDDYIKQMEQFLKLCKKIDGFNFIRAEGKKDPLLEAVLIGNVYDTPDLIEKYTKIAESAFSRLW